jgi:hypothetical protein
LNPKKYYSNMTVSLGYSNRCIEVSLDEYLRMTDDDFRDLIAGEQGYTLNHPFTNTCLLDLIGQKGNR